MSAPVRLMRRGLTGGGLLAVLIGPRRATGNAAAADAVPPPPGAVPLRARGAFDVTVGEGLATTRAVLGAAFYHVEIQRWRVAPDTTWAGVVAHYAAALGSGWTTRRYPAQGDLRVCEWDRGWPDPRRFAVSLLDRVITAPDGAFKVLYVAVAPS